MRKQKLVSKVVENMFRWRADSVLRNTLWVALAASALSCAAPPTPTLKGYPFNPVCPNGYTLNNNLCTPPTEGGPFGTQFGIMYSTWHCSFGGGSVNPSDVSKVLKGEQSWSAYGSVYWKSRPLDGYYCPSQRDDVLRKHAIELRDAGISFVFIDASNHSSTVRSDRSRQMILEPLAAMLRVWSRIPGAPRIVPFVPVTVDANPMIDAMMGMLAQYPQMQMIREGKPFFLLTTNPALPIDQSKLNGLSSRYSYRRMWSHLSPGFTSDSWSVASMCADRNGFISSNGNAACNQLVTNINGVEHVAISPALNSFIFSESSQAVSRFGGKTFAKQFATVYNNPTTRFSTIADWNSWVAIHFCMRSDGTLSRKASECIPNTHEFVDTYTDELSRDMEPSASQGDFYYRMMKGCIAKFNTGKTCDEGTANAVSSLAMGTSLGDAVQRACTYPAESSIPSKQTGEVYGYVDGLSPRGNRVILRGWACVVGSSAAIDLDVYLGGSEGAAGVKRARIRTTLAAEQGVHNACQNSGSTPNRYEVDVTDWMRDHPGQRIYVHGINPSNSKNYYLFNSGRCAIPWAESI